ncbi:MAG TPA: PEP/pyruvate-binding domain-containing protein [Phycisphaerae bacterium]|nr:PEP/pyruvate-binding domain-containing protein [Phycisphaerae bacterium]
MKKFVYFFGAGKAEGKGTDKNLLGGKGAGLAEMTNIGLPVPAGFTIAVDACAYFHEHNGTWPEGLEKEVRQQLARLEKTVGKKLGDKNNPLLVSVRSGAARSMPGMMETILNLGMNDQSVEGLARNTKNPRFAWDSYRRFLQMYSTTAVGLSKDILEEKLHNLKERLDKRYDYELPAEALQELCGQFKDFFREQTGREFPQDPWEQLVGAINAVFNSWNAEKAVTYRRVEKITDLTGTGVNVQQMVFGNMGEDSGTGVCFTRDPSTGANEFYGDMLINAQGEDVVAGIRTPLHMSELAERMPAMYDQLCAVRAMLEVHYGEMQDVEFTFERGKLYILQCRTGKRTPHAAFRIAVEQATQPLMRREEARRLAKAGYLPRKYEERAARPVISQDDAIARITGNDIERLFYPIISQRVPREELGRRRIAEGINAVPGAACGKVVFTAREAEALAEQGEDVILVRKETSPEDVGGMQAAKGILTQTGGKTSHAAVVARGWGKCCIVGCEALRIDYGTKQMSVNGKVVRQGEFLTLDGSIGAVYEGKLDLERPEPPQEYYTLMGWADQRREIGVRTNADTPEDARKAIQMGAEGIGLCRTEHMFFATHERQLAIQEMILADTEAKRRAALDKLLPFQRSDFIGIFEAMEGNPVTIRLIDPPLHEFVPKTREEAERLSAVTGVNPNDILARAEQLHESNPMLGHRGCRLCITYPEILEMQVRAIIEAAVDLKKRGLPVNPEIMIPLTIDPKELRILADRTRAVADGVIAEAGIELSYLVGTMVETPRAALLAGPVAETAEFFSFGTNDLTQMTMGLSRDDAGRFLPEYIKTGIFKADPFQSLDQEGVGQLVRMAVENGRRARGKLKIGICGEHGGDPESVKFCHRVGMNYVSCSPYRVPIARLAAAQAAIESGPSPLKGKAPRGTSKKAASAAKRPAKPAAKSKPAARAKAGARKAKAAKKSRK